MYQETLWRELFREVVKLTDLLIPKSESQTSAILSINADIEIPLASLNEAQKKVVDAFCQIGQLKGINMQSVESNKAPIGIISEASEIKHQGTDIAPINNPWISGLFYLFAVVVIMAVLATMAKMLSAWILPLLILGGLLLVTIIGAFQLRNDSKIDEKNFLVLMKLVFQKMPLLGKLFSKKKTE